MSDQVPVVIPTQIHEESPGVTSSKRVAGLIMVGLGAGLLVILGIWSILAKTADSDTTFKCGMALIITGAALLGVTIFEGFFRR